MKLVNIDAKALASTVRNMYCEEGIIPSGRTAVYPNCVVVRGYREGMYKYKGMWWRVKVTASTKATPEHEGDIRTRLGIRICYDTDLSKTYSTHVTLGLPQEKGVTNAVVMNCIKDMCEFHSI